MVFDRVSRRKFVGSMTVAAAMGLAGCPGDDDGGDGPTGDNETDEETPTEEEPEEPQAELQVRAVHAAAGAPNVDIHVGEDEEEPLFEDVPYKTVSDYETVSADAGDLRITAAGDESEVLVEESLEAEAEQAYTVVAYPEEEGDGMDEEDGAGNESQMDEEGGNESEMDEGNESGMDNESEEETPEEDMQEEENDSSTEEGNESEMDEGNESEMDNETQEETPDGEMEGEVSLQVEILQDRTVEEEDDGAGAEDDAGAGNESEMDEEGGNESEMDEGNESGMDNESEDNDSSMEEDNDSSMEEDNESEMDEGNESEMDEGNESEMDNETEGEETPEGEMDAEAEVRAFHASPDADDVDIALDDEEEPLLTEVSFGEASDYETTESGTRVLEVRSAGESEALVETDAELRGDRGHTAFAVGYAETEEDDETALDVIVAVEGENVEDETGGAEDDPAMGDDGEDNESDMDEEGGNESEMDEEGGNESDMDEEGNESDTDDEEAQERLATF